MHCATVTAPQGAVLMSKKTDRERRLRLFNRGNTQCPICFTPFTLPQVIAGKLVTLEHAPPEALGGKVVCLTCVECNNRASRSDHLAKLSHRAKHDHTSGRGTKVEVDFFGAGIVSGYARPPDDEAAARLSRQPVPTSINQLRGGVIRLPYIPTSSKLNVKKGIRFRIRQANPHKVSVSWLRSGYLLLFSLLGKAGYRYVKSESLTPIRKQIMDPDTVHIKGCLSGSIKGIDFPIDPIIMLNCAIEPLFWAVKMGDRCTFLPCGGPIESFSQLTCKPIDLSVSADRSGFWTSTQFRNECVLDFALKVQSDLNDTAFIGGRLEVQTNQGRLLEWIIVDYQEDELIALPLRFKDEKTTDDTVGIMMMLGEDEYKGRKGRHLFAAASPKTLLSLTVDLKRGEHE